jgi:prolyl 4-hydroxylase
MMKATSCIGSCTSNNNIILLFLVAGVVILSLDQWKTENESSSFPAVGVLVAAFAAAGGGGGFGGSGSKGAGGGFSSVGKTKNKNTSNKKANKNNTKKKRSGLAEMTTTTTTTKSNTKGELDKWGLPPTTLEDIFPPLPGDTKLDPIDSSKDHYTLSEIQDSLKDHVDLGDITRYFDDMGFAKIPNDDGTIMRLRLLHQSPPVLSLDHFLTEDECRDIRSVATTADADADDEASSSTIAHRVDSATFQGALSTRTSTSWFCRYDKLPILLTKAHHLLGVPLETMEEPQIVRYKGGEEFSWHYDEVPSSQLTNGGQRLGTLLVYLTEVPSSKGGGTAFRDLKESSSSSSPLVMQPQMGSALLFFPSFKDGRPDDRTLHKSEVLIGDDRENNNNNNNNNNNDNDDDYKWIVQMWTHQRNYQATLPVGNSNETARDIVEEIGTKLGYTDVDSTERR